MRGVLRSVWTASALNMTQVEAPVPAAPQGEEQPAPILPTNEKLSGSQQSVTDSEERKGAAPPMASFITSSVQKHHKRKGERLPPVFATLLHRIQLLSPSLFVEPDLSKSQPPPFGTTADAEPQHHAVMVSKRQKQPLVSSGEEQTQVRAVGEG